MKAQTDRDELVDTSKVYRGDVSIDWKISDGLIPYKEALSWMEARVEEVNEGKVPECIWLLEHPPLYTAGTSAKPEDLVQPDRFDVHKTGRGGQYTYHGPGQRVAYVILNLAHRGLDVRAFVASLEQWIIETLSAFNVAGERREDRVGVWVKRPEKAPIPPQTVAEDKIAALGIRVRKRVTFHGIAINVEPDLSHFDGIVPCGVRQHGVTSLVDLGHPVTMTDLDMELRREAERLFGPTVLSAEPEFPRDETFQ